MSRPSVADLPLRETALLLLAVVAGSCDDVQRGLECEAVAISDAGGDPDPCDVAACEACTDACGGSCAVLESYPPQYACPDGAGTVYDTCPDWEPPSTGILATDIVDLGCGEAGEEDLTALDVGGGRVEVLHLDYATGCCPTAVGIEVEVEGDTIAVAYTLVDDLCDCACALDVSYDLVSVPAGDWTIVAGEAEAAVHVEPSDGSAEARMAPGPRDTALRGGCAARGCATSPVSAAWLALAPWGFARRRQDTRRPAANR